MCIRAIVFASTNFDRNVAQFDARVSSACRDFYVETINFIVVSRYSANSAGARHDHGKKGVSR